MSRSYYVFGRDERKGEMKDNLFLILMWAGKLSVKEIIKMNENDEWDSI